MKNIKVSHLLFSLVLIATLSLALVPTAPAHALSASVITSPVLTENQSGAPMLSASGALVCRSIVVWRHGHRFVVRKCHRVTTQPI
jgi:hypothetical protein